MSIKILFCDIDGTLTETISGNAFKQHPQDVKIIEGADRAIAHFHGQGWLIIGISNQGGIEKGFKSIVTAIEEMAYTLSLFPQLAKIYFCADFKGKEVYFVDRLECDRILLPENFISCRKPSPGMIKHVLNALVTPIEDIWLVGDRLEDEQAAINAGINFCPADMWRNRFCSDTFAHTATPEQIKFLEGVSRA